MIIEPPHNGGIVPPWLRPDLHPDTPRIMQMHTPRNTTNYSTQMIDTYQTTKPRGTRQGALRDGYEKLGTGQRYIENMRRDLHRALAYEKAIKELHANRTAN